MVRVCIYGFRPNILDCVHILVKYCKYLLEVINGMISDERPQSLYILKNVTHL